jgi:hypothetical protein
LINYALHLFKNGAGVEVKAMDACIDRDSQLLTICMLYCLLLVSRQTGIMSSTILAMIMDMMIVDTLMRQLMQISSQTLYWFEQAVSPIGH